jgi:fructosamine-3-kinase
LNTPLREPLEAVVSDYWGREWRLRRVRDVSDLACHPCALLSDSSVEVFVKYSAAPDAERQFEIEQASLRFLSRNAGVLVPTPVGTVPVPGGTLFVMEALQPVARGHGQWRQIGRTLARIHRVTSGNHGFHVDTYFGPLLQDNTPTDDWSLFYAERRLRPRLRLAVDSGNVPFSVVAQVESVIDRLPDLIGTETTPTLLHGDAQQNNFISTAEGACVIDPAIYYGNREVDLAFVDYFQPVPEDVFDGYREELPIPDGFSERRDLWRISGYLACVAVEGPTYLDMLTDALQPYV